MKQTGTQGTGGLWNAPNPDASNSSGFTALPGSYRDEVGKFESIWLTASFWSATESSGGAWGRLLFHDDGDVSRLSVYKTWGMSIRCLKD